MYGHVIIVCLVAFLNVRILLGKSGLVFPKLTNVTIHMNST